MKKYIIIMKNSFMSNLSFRSNFLFKIGSSSFMILVLYFFWKAIYSNADSGAINGMSFKEVFLYVALANTISNFFKTWTDWTLSRSIISGEIIMDFLKPVNIQYVRLFDCLGSVISNFLSVSIPTVLVVFLVFQMKLVVGLNLLYFIISLSFAFLINFHFDYFIGIVAFYTESTWGISTAKEIVILFFSGAVVPLPFFPTSFRNVLEFLPFQAIYHTPLTLFTIPELSAIQIIKLFSVQFAWVVVMFYGNKLFLRRAMKVLTVNGG
jgi:ABC-2 type transport system permease protein